ncbi:MAG TPA: penicillin-binding protein [Candidatus Acidoferrales bacterium]
MEQRNPRLRWLIVWVLAAIWMAAVLARLGYLQLFCYSDYFAKAQHQQQRTYDISPTRGYIYDRKGRELAISMPMDSVFGDPAEIKDPEMVARLLSRVLNVPADDLATKIRDASKPVRLAKKLSPETVERIDDLNLKGVFFQKENRRVYPQHEFLSHVLGWVDTDEKGMGGIEQKLDDVIRGRAGRAFVMADGKRNLYDRNEASADPGASVVLTIDETIQYIAEKERAAVIAESHAKSGTVVVQDPSNGELLAVANYPTFDPNDAGKFPPEDRQDLAVAASYEPGSTFKAITMAGAIEDGLTNPAEMIDCQMGSIVVAGRLIHDHLPFGILSVRDVLAKSSDVGTIKIAERLGASRFYEVIRDFGIGETTGIELPGENRGKIRTVANWTPSSIGSVAIGQEVSVTPVQIISAISAIANGGTLYRSHLVKEIRNSATLPLPVRPEPSQATDAKTAATVREMMENVILHGTGTPAQLSGYTAAGKSGTAQKIDPLTGRYSPTQYIASFVGFAPVNEPAVTILVVLDSPVGQHMGGNLGGPVFKRIAEQVLAYLDVPHDVPMNSDLEFAGNKSQKPDAGADAAQQAAMHAKERDDAQAEAQFQNAVSKSGADRSAAPGQPQTVAFSGEESIDVPDLSGQTVRGVTETCSRLGLIPQLIGQGIAIEQSPAAGTPAQRGGGVTVRFGKLSADANAAPNSATASRKPAAKSALPANRNVN